MTTLKVLLAVVVLAVLGCGEPEIVVQPQPPLLLCDCWWTAAGCPLTTLPSSPCACRCVSATAEGHEAK